MYNNIKSRVRTAEVTSAFFPCQTGVHCTSGENLSLLLYSIYLNDLKGYLNADKVPGISCETLDENTSLVIKIIVLLFADDTVIFGSSKEDLHY